MMKLSKVEQLEELNLEKEIKEILTNYINILDDNYGSNRDIEKDLVGYVLIAENIVVIEMLSKISYKE